MLRRLGIAGRFGLFGRLSLLGRLSAILAAFLLAFVALAVALRYLTQSAEDAAAQRFPAPEQAAAIVEMLDVTPPEHLGRALRAAQRPEFSVTLAEAPPALTPGDQRMPGVEWLIGQYLEEARERDVIAARSGLLPPAVDGGPPLATPDVRIAVALLSGGYAVFELRAATQLSIFGVPAGFWLGFAGCLFAALAFWGVAREARPLRRLAASVEGFGADGAPRPTEPRGAPEIRRLIEAVNAMQRRIALLLRGRLILLGAVSHDLKTFATRLRLRVEEIPDADQRGKAAADLEGMTQLIDDAMALARGADELRRTERVDLRALVETEVAARAPAPLTFDARADAAAAVRGDPVALRRAVANVLDNAQRYAARAKASVTAADGRVAVIVEDDGPGVPEGERELIFEPFARLEPSRAAATGGAGLGLAIVRQVVDAHGGSVRVSRASGANGLAGARFELTLPSADGQSMIEPDGSIRRLGSCDQTRD